MKSNKKILVAALIACLGFGGSYVYAEEADQAAPAPVEEGTEKPEVKMVNYGIGLSFKALEAPKYESQAGAVITLTNNETEEVYTYTTEITRHWQKIPAGEYTMHLVSAPAELEGRFDYPNDEVFEVKNTGSRGFNVVEKAKQEPEPQPDPDDKPDEKPEDKPEDKPETKPSDDYEYDFYLPSNDEEKDEKKEEKEESKDDRSDEELAADIEETDKEINDLLDKNEEKKKEENKENKENEEKEEEKKPEKEESKPEKGKKDKESAPAKKGNPKTGVASVGYLGGLAAISMAGIVASRKRK